MSNTVERLIISIEIFKSSFIILFVHWQFKVNLSKHYVQFCFLNSIFVKHDSIVSIDNLFTLY